MHSIALSSDGELFTWGQPLTTWMTSIDSNVYAKQRLPHRVEGATGTIPCHLPHHIPHNHPPHLPHHPTHHCQNQALPLTNDTLLTKSHAVMPTRLRYPAGR